MHCASVIIIAVYCRPSSKEGTISKQSLPEDPKKKKRCGTNNDKTPRHNCKKPTYKQGTTAKEELPWNGQQKKKYKQQQQQKNKTKQKKQQKKKQTTKQQNNNKKKKKKKNNNKKTRGFRLCPNENRPDFWCRSKLQIYVQSK